MAHALKLRETADEPHNAEFMALCEAIIAQERANSEALSSLLEKGRREVERGNKMLVELGLRPV